MKDEKTVVLHLSDTLAASLQQETKEITIKNVKLADDVTKSFATYTEKVKFLDLTPPTVTEVKQVAPNQIRVFFSEPVKAVTGDFLIDDGKYSASVSAVEPLTNSVLINTGNLADGEHTLKVKNTVKDYAGWRAAETDDASKRKITVFFSEAMDGSIAIDKSKYTLVINGTELPLPSDAQVTMGSNNASVEIVLPTVMKDKNGNEVTVDGSGDELYRCTLKH